jgi:hypothetical protein
VLDHPSFYDVCGIMLLLFRFDQSAALPLLSNESNC